jgi:hypothetical protein
MLAVVVPSSPMAWDWVLGQLGSSYWGNSLLADLSKITIFATFYERNSEHAQGGKVSKT